MLLRPSKAKIGWSRLILHITYEYPLILETKLTIWHLIFTFMFSVHYCHHHTATLHSTECHAAGIRVRYIPYYLLAMAVSQKDDLRHARNTLYAIIIKRRLYIHSMYKVFYLERGRLFIIHFLLLRYYIHT